MVEVQIAFAEMTGEEFIALDIIESLLDFVHQTGADPPILTVRMDDELADETGAKLDISPDRANDFAFCRCFQIQAAVEVGQDFRKSLREGRDAELIVDFGFAEVSEFLQLEDFSSIADVGGLDDHDIPLFRPHLHKGVVLHLVDEDRWVQAIAFGIVGD